MPTGGGMVTTLDITPIGDIIPTTITCTTLVIVITTTIIIITADTMLLEEGTHTQILIM